MTKTVRNLLIAFFLGLSASMAYAVADIDGEWNVSLTAPEGATYFKMTVASDGEMVTGRIGETVLSGTYIDGRLKLKGDYYVVEAGYTSKLDMDIRLQGDRLQGKATWDMYTADVSGKRPK